MRGTEHDFDLIVEVSGLIDAWCDRRELRALGRLLPAWLANDGLTDGWRDVLEALSAIRADDRPPDDEAFVIECSIAAVEPMVYRSSVPCGAYVPRSRGHAGRATARGTDLRIAARTIAP